MISLDVTADNQTGLAGILSGLTSQLPYAYSVAINKTLDAAQTAIQDSLPDRFRLRHAAFIEQTVKIAPQDRATKTNLVGTVRINPDRNFLAKFEDGGQKVGQHSLAVPIMRLDGDPNLIIGPGDPLSVKRLMASIQNSGGKIVRPRIRKGQLRVSVDPNKVYLVKSASGTFIVQRTGPNQTRVLYAFKKEVPIPASLHFDEIAMGAALATWDANFAAAMDRAIATMR